MKPTDPCFASVPAYARPALAARSSLTLVTVDTRGKASKARTESSPKESMVVRACVAAAILAALASCGREAAPRAGDAPPVSVPAGAPHAWCQPCADVENLGTTPWVKRRGPVVVGRAP